MVSLNNVGIGSIILNQIENVPTSISGAPLWNIVDNERFNAENLIGESISSDIPEKYQPAIISLSSSAVVNFMELQGADVSNIKLGDFTINKGGQSNTSITSQSLREDGLTKLNNLGISFEHYKSV